MNEIEEFVDDRQKSWCVHCARWLADLATNEDHVPSRCLLRKPYPPHLPRVKVCSACNVGFSLDEEYLAAFLGTVLVGSTDPDHQTNPTASRILRRNPKLRSRIEGSKKEYVTRGGETRRLWQPEVERVNRVVLKNARGHAYFEYGDPMLPAPTHVWAAPFGAMTDMERLDFEDTVAGPLWPEVGSRMMTRVVTGQDLQNGWVFVQDGIYRYAVVQLDGLLVRSVLSECLATEVYWSE